MIFVKICGITNTEDANCAISSGADALGFVAYRKSPRYIPPERVAAIIATIFGVNSEKRHSPSAMPRLVGVFVNEDPVVVAQYIAAGVDTVQLHGDEDAAEAGRLVTRLSGACGNDQRDRTPSVPEIWKAFRADNEQKMERLAGFPADRFLVDSCVQGEFGGTGVTADWRLARRAVTLLQRPVILAGGLTPDNVAEAVRCVAPFGLDVSSGVEKKPGVKDHHLVMKFVAEARRSHL